METRQNIQRARGWKKQRESRKQRGKKWSTKQDRSGQQEGEALPPSLPPSLAPFSARLGYAAGHWKAVAMALALVGKWLWRRRLRWTASHSRHGGEHQRHRFSFLPSTQSPPWRGLPRWILPDVAAWVPPRLMLLHASCFTRLVSVRSHVEFPDSFQVFGHNSLCFYFQWGYSYLESKNDDRI